MKIISKNILLLLLLTYFTLPSTGQVNTVKLTLQDVLHIATTQSRDAMAAKHKFTSSYWQYKTFRATYMPKLTLDATFPGLERAINKYTLPDGKETFIPQSYINYTMDLSISKKIGGLGGTLFVNSGLQKLENYYDTISETQWLSNAITIGYNQPLFAYNSWKWENKIEPLKYEEAQRTYIEETERISINATGYFFDLLLAQIQQDIATINQSNYDTLYKIAQGRYNLGKIAENELLQLELSLLRSNADVENADLSLQMNLFRLKSFLSLSDDQFVELLSPGPPLLGLLNVDEASQAARNNRSDAVSFERQVLESESDLNRAKRDSRFNANLYAMFGLTQNSDLFSTVYENPHNQQRLTLGIQLPILDWGLSRGQIKVAESNLELVRTNIEQQEIDFNEEVLLKVMQYNMQKNQFAIAAKADTVAGKRYDVTKQRYLIGKITITDLNIAQTENDNARKGYISALRNYWQNYYEIRRLTLYDFENRQPLGVDFSTMY